MATNSAQGEQEEAFSFTGRPVNLIKEDEPEPKPDSQVIETQEDFDFRLWRGPFSEGPEMCAADEVFFQGQILPLRLSYSASDMTAGLLHRHGRQTERCRSMSGSVDRGHSLSESRSNSYSSRSSSLRSQNSSNGTSPIIATPKASNPRNHNRFHTHPSPKPQLRMSIPRQASFGNVGKKSSTWDFFRLGVVPAPEIELQDLKVRGTKNSVSHNSSTSNSSSNSGTPKSGKFCTNTHYRDKSNHGLKQFVAKGSGFLSGCKCSSSTETQPLDTVIISSGTKSTNTTKSVTHAMKEKVVLELKRQKQKQKQGKKALSRRRTFEWLKELSHASYLEEEALLLNS